MWRRELLNVSLAEQVEIDQQSISQSMRLLNLEDGTSLRIFDEGQGESIIFIATVPELDFVYAPQLEEFGKSHRVIFYEPQLSRQSFIRVSSRAQEVIFLMNALKIENAHIIAWSDSGSVAYYLAKNFPDRCKSVIMLGLADKYIYPEPLQFLSRALLNFPIENYIPAFVIARILAKFFSGPQVKFKSIMLRAQAIPQLTKYFKYSILPCMVDHMPHANEVDTPCLVVCGDKDALVSVEQAQRMAKMLPKAGDAVIIPNGEHLLAFANGESINQIIRDYYSTLSF